MMSQRFSTATLVSFLLSTLVVLLGNNAMPLAAHAVTVNSKPQHVETFGDESEDEHRDGLSAVKEDHSRMEEIFQHTKTTPTLLAPTSSAGDAYPQTTNERTIDFPSHGKVIDSEHGLSLEATTIGLVDSTTKDTGSDDMTATAGSDFVSAFSIGEEAALASLQRSSQELAQRSSRLIEMTAEEKIHFFHDLDKDLHSKELLVDQLIDTAGESFSGVKEALDMTKNALHRYFEISPRIIESLNEQATLLKDDWGGQKQSRRLFGGGKFGGARSSKFGGNGNSQQFKFKSFHSASRQNPYRHKDMPITGSNVHYHILHNMNGKGHARRLKMQSQLSTFMDPSSKKDSVFGQTNSNSRRQMFQADWPTDAPVPTQAPSVTDPLVDNCGLLVECVNMMSLYDLFVLFHSDDIDPDDGTLDIDLDADDPFATFRRFDEEDVVGKFNSVKTKAKRMADGGDPIDLSTCSDLLEEFHRLVEFDEVNNWQGASVSQVCFAEGTQVFVQLAEIAKVESEGDSTVGETIAKSVFRDFFACTTKLANGRENPFQQQGTENLLRIPIGYDDSLTDEHGRPQAETYPFEYKDLTIYGDIDFFRPLNMNLPQQCEESVRDYYNNVFESLGSEVPCYSEIFLQTAPLNSPDIPDDVTCTSQGLCDADDDDCVESCVYIYPQECFSGAQVDDAVLEAIQAIEPPKCDLNHFRGEMSQCSASGGFPLRCRYARVNEDEILPEVEDFAELDLAVQLVFGDKASVGFVCSLAESVVNDNKMLPGRCCLDAPYSKTNEALWGQPYVCSNDCEVNGPFFAGIDEEACSAYGGTWCPNPQDCSLLADCIQDFINKEIAENSEGERPPETGFFAYLTESPRITDPMNSMQCEMARIYFGFDQFFLDDKTVCADINQLRFTEEFSFLDEFFNQGTGGSVSNCEGQGVECFLKEPKGDSSSPCTADDGKKRRQQVFILDQVAQVADDAFNVLDAGCPDDAISKFTGCGIAEIIAYVIFAALRISADIVENLYNEQCEFGNIEPQRILFSTEVLYDNMVVTLEKILDVQSTVTAIEGAIESVQGSIDADSRPPGPVGSTQNAVMFRGCNGKDDDFDAFVDECDEDDSPPQIVVPDSLRQQNTCMGQQNTICLELYFKTIDAAIEYLNATLRVEDDCAQGPAIRLDIIAITDPACDMTKFVVTPVHKCTSERGIEAEVCGTALTFEMGVDGVIPHVTCGFNSESATTSPNGTNILVLDEEDDNLEDTGFFFDIEENCPENVRVDVSVKTNELVKTMQDMIVLEPFENLEGVNQAILCVDTGFCGETGKKSASSFCIRDPDPRVVTRFYEITTVATDAAGNTDSEICVVFVRPNGGKKDGGSKKKVDREDLWNSYVLWSKTRFFLGAASLAWDNELAPSDMPSMMPSISAMPTVPPRSKKSSSSDDWEEETRNDATIVGSRAPSSFQTTSMPTWPKRGPGRNENANAAHSVDESDFIFAAVDSITSKKASSSDVESAAVSMGSIAVSISEKSKKESSDSDDE